MLDTLALPIRESHGFLIKVQIAVVAVTLACAPLSAAEFDEGLQFLQDKNYQAAIEIFTPLAEGGSVQAQVNLAFAYAALNDDSNAFMWTKKAAEGGHAQSQANLAVRYDVGSMVGVDKEEAVKWYELSAAQGNAVAQYNLGVKYGKGENVRQDYVRAIDYLNRAADQGMPEALNTLGNLYNEGVGTSQNYVEASRLYRLAAEKNFPQSQSSLSINYFYGRGVIKDIVYAYMWANIAAASGNEVASNNRDAFESEMTSEQLIDAQKLSRECIQKNYKEC